MDCHEAIDLMGEALEGGLATAARSGFDGHLEECAACRNYFDQLRVTRGVLRRLPREPEPGARPPGLIEAFRKEFRTED